jgi:hypothetical protein
MSFVERVGKMAAHARPSKLQARAALATRGAADATGKQSSATRHHRPAVKSSKTLPLPDAPTATFTFTGALDVPDAFELDEDVKIERAVLRACLIHGGEFVGDVASVPATNATNADGVAAWRFGSFSPRDEDPEAGGVGSYHLLARTDRDDVELFVELNVVPARGDAMTRTRTRTRLNQLGSARLPRASSGNRRWCRREAKGRMRFASRGDAFLGPTSASSEAPPVKRSTASTSRCAAAIAI